MESPGRLVRGSGDRGVDRSDAESVGTARDPLLAHARRRRGGSAPRRRPTSRGSGDQALHHGRERDLAGLRQCMNDLALKRGFVITNCAEPRRIGRDVRVIHVAASGERRRSSGAPVSRCTLTHLDQNPRLAADARDRELAPGASVTEVGAHGAPSRPLLRFRTARRGIVGRFRRCFGLLGLASNLGVGGSNPSRRASPFEHLRMPSRTGSAALTANRPPPKPARMPPLRHRRGDSSAPANPSPTD